jgi:hypothetical protein
VACRWCGCTTSDGTNHGTTDECLKALERQIQLLKEELECKRREERLAQRENSLPSRKRSG